MIPYDSPLKKVNNLFNITEHNAAYNIMIAGHDVHGQHT